MVKIISWTHADKDDPIYSEGFTFTSHSKHQSNLGKEKYDQEFSEAMKLKLKLNREGGLQALRRSIAEDTVKLHPKADIEDIMRAMKKMGF